MTPSDELWIEMASFDSDLADRIWDGTATTGVAPEWYGEVATLIRTAKGPARPDELAAEQDVVARMEAAILEEAGLLEEATILGEGAGDDRAPVPDVAAAGVCGDPAVVTLPASRRSRTQGAVGEGSARDGRTGRGARIVRRVVAVKAVAATTALAVGITAAAATTGIVTVVVPAARDRLKAEEQAPPAEAVEDEPSGRPAGRDRSGQEPRRTTTVPPSTPGGTVPPLSERSGSVDVEVGGAESGEAPTTPSTEADGTGGAGAVTGSTTVPAQPPVTHSPTSTPDPPVPTTPSTTPTTGTPPTTGTTITSMSVTEPEPEPTTTLLGTSGPVHTAGDG